MASCEAQLATAPVPAAKPPAPVAGVAGLPAGFPQTLDSPMAWAGADLKESEYILHLNDEDICEAEAALQHFKDLGLDGDLISRETFPLGKLGQKLSVVRQDVHNGKGFGVIRGLRPEKYIVEDLSMLYLGLQCFVANRHGRQDSKGNMLVHIVADNTSALAAGHHRHSNAQISFHNEEAGDIVSWLTRSTAASGGRCIIASGHTVYNVLANDRPDLVRTLAGSDWPFAIPQFHCRPVLFNHKGRIIINFGRTPLIGNATHPRPEDLPSVSPRQMEALDAIEKIARATELEIVTQAGDMHFINNLAILHRREGFVDGASTSQRRHLVRMRLRDDELGWAIPQELQQEWSKAFGESKKSKVWHLEPMPSGYFPLRKQPN